MGNSESYTSHTYAYSKNCNITRKAGSESPLGDNNNAGKNAICVIQSNRDENINGYIAFHQCQEGLPVKVMFALHGKPHKIHAIHIHEYGDITNGCASLGAHFNPHGVTHGSIMYSMNPRHAGDLINNIRFDKSGNFYYEYEDALISLFDGPLSILGRSIVIHEDEDDLGRGKNDKRAESLLTGNAGKRIAYGIIGHMKSLHK